MKTRWLWSLPVRARGLSVSYKGEFIGQYVADFLVEKCLIVEIEALSRLVAEHEAQVMNYLKATGLTVGLLLNFGTPRLGYDGLYGVTMTIKRFKDFICVYSRSFAD